ncbi:MAG TPA: glycosyltransferase family 39 protein [Bryobacteraceae bacterium]|nr:glycosyltransferase family 39 protein [Bryobacteraceae bacterium]
MWKRPAIVILGAVFAGAASFFERDVIRGVPSEHSLLNVESILALAFVAILLLRSHPNPATAQGGARAWAAALITGLIALAFAGSLRSPFLFDDYTHITDAAAYTFHVAAVQFGPVAHPPGLFFRPFGFFLYWLNYLFAGSNPVLWHATSIALHITSSVLVYLLCGAIGLPRLPALAAASLFAINGTTAETVAWIDARFDLMVTSLVLASLLLVCRYLRTVRPGWLAAALFVAAGAMLTKETAFCLPILIACLAFFQPASERRRIWTTSAWMAGLATALFAYRWWALGGIGGYRGPGGTPGIAQFSLVHAVNGLLLREWAILCFPFNWSLDRGPLSSCALAAIPLILAACAFTSKASRSRLAGCVALVIAASLPVQHLLLMGSTLAGARNLYLATVGWALLWGFALDGMNRRSATCIAGLLLAAQFVILQHNLAAWRDSAELAQSVCTQFGRTAAAMPGVLVVRGLPDTRNGAVFLHNGFPQCVEMNSGFPAARIYIQEPGQLRPAWATHEFVWNAALSQLEETKSE